MWGSEQYCVVHKYQLFFILFIPLYKANLLLILLRFFFGVCEICDIVAKSINFSIEYLVIKETVNHKIRLGL